MNVIYTKLRYILIITTTNHEDKAYLNRFIMVDLRVVCQLTFAVFPVVSCCVRHCWQKEWDAIGNTELGTINVMCGCGVQAVLLAGGGRSMSPSNRPHTREAMACHGNRTKMSSQTRGILWWLFVSSTSALVGKQSSTGALRHQYLSDRRAEGSIYCFLWCLEKLSVAWQETPSFHEEGFKHNTVWLHTLFLVYYMALLLFVPVSSLCLKGGTRN